jgi:ferredoxin
MSIMRRLRAPSLINSHVGHAERCNPFGQHIVAQQGTNWSSACRTGRLWVEACHGTIRRSCPAYAEAMAAIACVWIEEGCIPCGACHLSCPTVFIIPADTDEAQVPRAVRFDGVSSPNRVEMSPLSDLGHADSALIEEAVTGCPLDVVRFER